jgi:hypothetical protein
MRSPARDTAAYLVTQGVTGAFGGASGFPVYVGREPLEPVDVVTCYDTGGGAGALIDLRRPTVQVRVRAADYDAGWQKINAIFEALSAPTMVAVPDATILVWAQASDVSFIGRDDKDRPIFTANFEVLRDG